MQGQAPTVELHKTLVLHYKRIDAHGRQFVDESIHGRQFVVVKERIDRHIDPRAKDVGKGRELANILNTIACRSACTKALGTNIYGIGSMANGFKATLKVAGWGKKFNGTGHRGERGGFSVEG
jgi:hypothetical protein